MSPSYQRIGHQHFLYDDTILSEINPSFFEPDYWRNTGKIVGEAQGRGTVIFVSDGTHDFALRHYKRGGFISKLVTEHYFWQGLSKTRAWREWHLLHLMFQEGLPVPQPVAARVIKTGGFYTADLLTLTLPDCHSLASLLKKQTLTNEILFKIGQTILQFHEASIYHADLNAHNILINKQETIYLIDFDRGCRKEGNTWREKNLFRLKRSLCKIEKEAGRAAFPENRWGKLIQGYENR